MIQGADSFIVAAYVFAYAVLASYGAALYRRRKQAQAQLRAQERSPS